MTPTAEFIDICSEPGARIDIGLCRWPQDLAPANLHFLSLLAVATGSGESVGYAFVERGTPDTWRTLADVGAEVLEGIVRQMERNPNYRAWRLNGGEAVGIHDRIRVHFNTAQARYQRGDS